MSGFRRSALAVVGCMALGAASLTAQVANGGFETNGGAGSNTFASWTVVDQPGGSGSWFAQTGTLSPQFGSPVLAPPEGTFAAMTDQGGPGSHIIYQDVTVPASGGTLSFSLYINNRAGAFATPATLDFTAGPNQQFRMDIMSTAAPVTDVGAGVLLNVYQTKVGDPAVSGYTTILASLSSFAGQTVRLRFVEVDNAGVFNVGVDNVGIIGAVPTLSLPMLVALGLLLGTAAVWKLRTA